MALFSSNSISVEVDGSLASFLKSIILLSRTVWYGFPSALEIGILIV
jgi:hypothetical protein